MDGGRSIPYPASDFIANTLPQTQTSCHRHPEPPLVKTAIDWFLGPFAGSWRAGPLDRRDVTRRPVRDTDTNQAGID
jgi:hypothetical protein